MLGSSRTRPRLTARLPTRSRQEDFPKRNSLAVSGWGRHSLHDFTMRDKEGREVVSLKSISDATDVNALKRGAFHVKTGKIESVELTLYRDDRARGTKMGPNALCASLQVRAARLLFLVF